MKKILLLLSFFLPSTLLAYYGDVQNFVIEENSICLNAPEEASQACLSMSSQVANDAHWQSQISLSFSPTSSNYLKWFLMADSASLNASSSAYYIMFGGTSRTIHFYYLKNGKSTLVHKENDMLLNNSQNHINIEVQRSDLENWHVEYSINDTLSGSFVFAHNMLGYSSYFGWHCVYTKTRSKGFCFNNTSVTGSMATKPRKPQKGELLINEILFNPEGDGVDFIEILNVSDTVFDISNCLLGNKKQTYFLPTYLLLPDSVVAITKDSALLCIQNKCLYPQNIVQVEKMLPLPSDSGFVRIMCDSSTIDTLYYRANMHHALLNNVEGLSLERLPDGSWQSASTIIKSTPGYRNSRFINNEYNNLFSEDGDFFKLLSSSIHIYDTELPENLVLLYRLHKAYRTSVKVFSLNGYNVFTILDSELFHGEGRLYWDGRGENSEILPVGMYVLVIELYSEDTGYSVKKHPIAIIP